MNNTVVAIEAQYELDVDELGRACRCSREWIVTLVHEGVLQPADAQAQPWRFRAEALQRARRAARLMHDLELNAGGVALVMQLLDRIESLEQQLQPRRA